MAALTATAAPPVRQEIVERLGLRDPRQVIRDFDRPEIHLAVRAFHRADDRRQAITSGARLVLEAEADRLTVLFDDYGYRELATQVASGKHLLAPA